MDVHFCGNLVYVYSTSEMLARLCSGVAGPSYGIQRYLLYSRAGMCAVCFSVRGRGIDSALIAANVDLEAEWEESKGH